MRSIRKEFLIVMKKNADENPTICRKSGDLKVKLRKRWRRKLVVRVKLNTVVGKANLWTSIVFCGYERIEEIIIIGTLIHG